MVHARAILTALDTQQAWEAQILSQPAVSSLIWPAWRCCGANKLPLQKQARLPTFFHAKAPIKKVLDDCFFPGMLMLFANNSYLHLNLHTFFS